MNKLIPLAALLLAIAGCKETPNETRRDVADARAEGAEEIREAQADRDALPRTNATRATPVRDMVSGTAAEQRADADHEVAMARAQATLDVEKEKCEAHTGDRRDTCKEIAEAVFDRAEATADAARDRRSNDGRRLDPNRPYNND